MHHQDLHDRSPTHDDTIDQFSQLPPRLLRQRLRGLDEYEVYSVILQESHHLSQATAPELLLMIIFENARERRIQERERRRCSVTSTRSLTTSVVSEKDARSKMAEM